MGTEQEMTPEQKAERRNKLLRKRKIRKLIVTVVISALVLAVVFAVLFFALFRVSAVRVEGVTSYPSSEILDAASIETGKNLFFIDYDALQKQIEQKLPYCDNVKIKKKLPSTLIINVEQSKEVFSVIVDNGIFAITNEDLKVLDVSGDYHMGTILVEGNSEAVNYQLGVELPFTDVAGDDPVKTALSTVCQAIEDSEIEGIEYINVEDKHNIFLIYDDRIIIKIGDTNDIIHKMSLAKKAIDEENKLSSSQYGELDVTITEKAIFAPKDYKNMERLVAYDRNMAIATIVEAAPDPDETSDEKGEAETEEEETEASGDETDSEENVNN